MPQLSVPLENSNPFFQAVTLFVSEHYILLAIVTTKLPNAASFNAPTPQSAKLLIDGSRTRSFGNKYLQSSPSLFVPRRHARVSTGSPAPRAASNRPNRFIVHCDARTRTVHYRLIILNGCGADLTGALFAFHLVAQANCGCLRRFRMRRPPEPRRNGRGVGRHVCGWELRRLTCTL